jgi:hypothetical protein
MCEMCGDRILAKIVAVSEEIDWQDEFVNSCCTVSALFNANTVAYRRWQVSDDEGHYKRTSDLRALRLIVLRECLDRLPSQNTLSKNCKSFERNSLYKIDTVGIGQTERARFRPHRLQRAEALTISLPHQSQLL